MSVDLKTRAIEQTQEHWRLGVLLSYLHQRDNIFSKGGDQVFQIMKEHAEIFMMLLRALMLGRLVI